MIKRSLHLLLLAAAMLAAASCATFTKLAYSNVAFAYSNLAPMLTWMVDDYVDLSETQKEWVRGRITRILHWHRMHELPEYHRFLERALRESEEPFTVKEIDEGWRELRLHYHRTLEQALPDVADFMLQLDAEQKAQLERKFADDNRKFVKESVKGTPEERLERRAKRFVTHLEGWIGDVTEAQRQLIEEHYRGIPDLIEERLGDRRFRQTETMALIRARPPKEQMVEGLKRLLVDTDSWRRQEFTRKLNERDQRLFGMLSALSTTLSREQRAALQQRIRGYMRDITTINASN